MERYGYLVRLRLRRDTRSLRDSVIFALALGWLLFAIGAFKRFLVIGSNEALWTGVAVAGAIVLLASVIDPRLIRPLYDTAHRAGLLISSVVFRVVLTIVYALMIVPAGLWLRSRRGTHPFYAWTAAPPADAEGWTAKTMPRVRRDEIRVQRASTIREAASIVQYFLAVRQYAFLPVLIALIALGLILFIVQTSALAPFIYTLF